MIEQLLTLSELSEKDQEYFLPKFYCLGVTLSGKTIVNTINIVKSFENVGISCDFLKSSVDDIWFTIGSQFYMSISGIRGIIKLFSMPDWEDVYYYKESDDFKDFFDTLNINLIKEKLGVG